ncbi:hypothetical protein IMZ48_16400 [Candidatus Bathyarchaeota archaeon]|nr:hypothetical protein [Candidatus Bathyarchaeota archaeon]
MTSGDGRRQKNQRELRLETTREMKEGKHRRRRDGSWTQKRGFVSDDGACSGRSVGFWSRGKERGVLLRKEKKVLTPLEEGASGAE